MSSPALPAHQPTEIAIRPIDPRSDAEIDRVARRMRATLVEVEGEEVGGSLYTLDWLRDRVRWHLDPANCDGAVLLAVRPTGEILGHVIVRVEADEQGRPYGLFSTIYVDPAARRQQVAERLVTAGEQWLGARRLPLFATWTSATNTKLFGLLGKSGYAIVERATHAVTRTDMVKLTKTPVPPAPPPVA